MFYLLDVSLGGGDSEYVNNNVGRERQCARPSEKGSAKGLTHNKPTAKGTTQNKPTPAHPATTHVLAAAKAGANRKHLAWVGR